MTSTSSIMTDEIAYKLGEYKFKTFYNQVMWKVNKEPFELYHFFNWSLNCLGMPVIMIEKGYRIDWENINAYGTLNTSLFKGVSHELNYIRGWLKSHPPYVRDNIVTINYANSYDLRDFMAQCLLDVITDKFLLMPRIEGECGRNFVRDRPKFNVNKTEIMGCVPGCPSIELVANDTIIQYLLG